jgi:hypothetical protein
MRVVNILQDTFIEKRERFLYKRALPFSPLLRRSKKFTAHLLVLVPARRARPQYVA